MASIFASPYTLTSYLNPTGVTTTKTSLGAVTIPDPGFDWTPIVFAQVSFYSGTKECGALVEARLGTTATGTLLASGSGGNPSFSTSVLGTVDVAPAYANGVSSAPSYTGSQTITLWIVRLSGASTGSVNTLAGSTRATIYALPTT